MRGRRLAVALASALLLVGCGADRPGDAVPSLVEQVAQVDDAVAAGDDRAAREALTTLVADTERAAADGALAQADADAITDAAQVLLSRLEGPEPAEDPDLGSAEDEAREEEPDDEVGDDAGPEDEDESEGKTKTAKKTSGKGTKHTKGRKDRD